MIICPRCGYQAPDGTPYCPRCGYGRQHVPQQKLILCPHCNNWIPIESRFCPQCGKDPFSNGKESKKSKSGSGCFGDILKIIGLSTIIIIFAVFFSLCSTKSRTKNSNQTMAAVRATTEILRRETEAPKLTKTAEYLLTPTRTPEPTLPPICKDKQMDIIRIAEILDAEGFPYPDYYDPDRNACVYRITDQSSFLNMDFFGYLSVFYDDNNAPNGAITEIYYKDNAATNEIITDWGAVALAFVDPTTNALAASSLVKTARTSGYSETENFGITGRLDTDNMVYTIGVLSMEQILSTVQ